MTKVDLRPLSMGEILDRTFWLYRRYFWLFVGITALPHLLTLALGLTQVFNMRSLVALGQGSGRISLPTTSLTGSVVFGLLGVVLGVVVYLLTQGGTIAAVNEIYLGRTTTIGDALKRAWNEAATLFGVILLNGLAVLAGMILLVIPGIYVACRLLVCVPAAMVEGKGPSESLSRSWNLTQKYAGRAFVLGLIYFVIQLGMGALIGAVLGGSVAMLRHDPSAMRMTLATQQVTTVLIEVLVTPILLIGTAVFYYDLRVRKEAFDLQMMMDPTSERRTGDGGPVPSIL